MPTTHLTQQAIQRRQVENHSHRIVVNTATQTTINALTLTFFSIGNIIGTEIFQPKDAPDYIPGKTAIMVLITTQIALALVLRLLNIRLNIKKQSKLSEEIQSQGWSEVDVQREREKAAFLDLTDKQCVDPPSFDGVKLMTGKKKYIFHIHDIVDAKHVLQLYTGYTILEVKSTGAHPSNSLDLVHLGSAFSG
jgi:hypothetical protein